MVNRSELNTKTIMEKVIYEDQSGHSNKDKNQKCKSSNMKNTISSRKEPLRLKEKRYILTGEQDIKLGARDLTKFCLERNIDRGKLLRKLNKGLPLDGWIIAEEDCAQNTNNRHTLSIEQKRAISLRNKGRNYTQQQRDRFREAQQHNYRLNDSVGKEYFVQSSELKRFCKTFKLCYSTLMTAKNLCKPYRGWNIIEVAKGHVNQGAQPPF